MGYDDTTTNVTAQLTYASVQIASNFEWTYHWHAIKRPAESGSYTRIKPYFLVDTSAGATEIDMAVDGHVHTIPLSSGQAGAATIATELERANE